MKMDWIDYLSRSFPGMRRTSYNKRITRREMGGITHFFSPTTPTNSRHLHRSPSRSSMSDPVRSFLPSGTATSSIPGSETANGHPPSTTPSGTVRKDRNPSPPPPVAGKKRDLRAPSAHNFNNVKLPKLHLYVSPLVAPYLEFYLSACIRTKLYLWS